MNIFRCLSFIIFVALIAACGGTTVYKLYDGPERLDSELATIIKDGYHIRVDGREISPKTLGDKIIKVLPGTHKVETVYTKGMSFDWHWYPMDVNLEAGKTYTIDRMTIKKSLNMPYTPNLPYYQQGMILYWAMDHVFADDEDHPLENKMFFWLKDMSTDEIVGGHRPVKKPDGKIYAIPEKGVDIS